MSESPQKPISLMVIAGITNPSRIELYGDWDPSVEGFVKKAVYVANALGSEGLKLCVEARGSVRDRLMGALEKAGLDPVHVDAEFEEVVPIAT